MSDVIFSLQETDSRKDKLERDYSGKEQRLVDIDKEISDATKAIDSLKNEQQAFSVDLRKMEGELDSLNQKKEQADSKLHNVTSAKQLDALRAQIEGLTTSIEEYEANLLEEYEKQETMDAKLQSMEEDIACLKETLGKEIAEIKDLLTQITSEKVTLTKKREELLPQVDEDLLTKYETLYARHKSKVIYETEDMVCPGCGMALARRLFDRMASHRDDFYGCNSCGRLLKYVGV